MRISVRAKPGSARTRDIKVVDIGDGERAVEISVAAAAQDGKANKALIARLAEEWGVPRKMVSIKAGETGRLKLVEIHGNPAVLARSIAEKLKTSL
ncbi:MAG: DUF167 domain-containing protein [Alphaproteobacteria bacterium]|nr:DUF167 domain-containing protein [Alphaproteobacteria bacterium]